LFAAPAENEDCRAGVAFLVDTDKYPAGSDQLNALLDAIVDWNNTRWGGRTSHVAFFSGGTLSDGEWRQIEITDPDCVLAFAPLSDSFLLELDERVNPWSIEIDDHTQSEANRISVRMDGIGMSPTVENLRRIRARYPLNFVREGFVQKTAFDELAEVAEALRPQRAIIFLPVENATKQWAEINGWLKELQARLGPQGIKLKFLRFRRFDLLCFRRRQNFQPGFFRNFHHARDVLLLLRTERASPEKFA
jgi:hypothetical protein